MSGSLSLETDNRCRPIIGPGDILLSDPDKTHGEALPVGRLVWGKVIHLYSLLTGAGVVNEFLRFSHSLNVHPPFPSPNKFLLGNYMPDVTNKIHRNTHQHFASFDIVPDVRHGKPVAVIDIQSSDIPIVFTAHGGYETPAGKGQKASFVKGSVYFRQGTKSEPGTTDDLREAIDRRLERVKGFWLNGIGKIMAAPAGSEVQLVQRAIALTNSEDAAPVRLTTDDSAASMGINKVILRDSRMLRQSA